jgi:hypothetical protein
VFATVWVSLLLFAAGEVGKRRVRGSGGMHRAAGFWAASAAGAALMIVHMLIAMGAVHGWSHRAAIEATAAQTRAVFGLDWGGGVFVNYAFLAVWIAELGAWRAAPGRYARWSPAIVWPLRAFNLVVIANAAIVFAAGWRRLAGAALTAGLVAIWMRRPRTLNLEP